MKKIKVVLDGFSELFKGKPDEIDAFLGPYRHMSMIQIDYILRVINAEIKKSKKFDLKILPKHQLYEKHAIMAAFDLWGHELNIDGPKYSDVEYSKKISDLVEMVNFLLRDEIAYYFNNSPEGTVKNRYNCHIADVVGRLAKDFMDNKCAPWMAKNTPD